MRTARPRGAPDGGPLVLLKSASDGRRRGAWIASLLLHLGAVAILSLLPRGVFETSPRAGARSVILIAPPQELTQAEPNRGRAQREFTVESLTAPLPVRVPPAIPPVQSAAAPKPVPAPPARRAPTLTPPPVIAPPVMHPSGAELAGVQPAPPHSSLPPAPPPPAIEPDEKPKLAFERPGLPGPARPPAPGAPRIATPGSTVAEAARAAARQGAGGLVVADTELPGSGGFGSGLNLPGMTPPPRNSSSLELLSDPMGVDFRPYLVQVLSSVRRNWRAVIPESARLGRRGRVQIQFAIARDGSVPKLVISLPSGTDALDRAAVAGISASNPFPPLPSNFTGKEVRLQFTFLYNIRD